MNFRKPRSWGNKPACNYDREVLAAASTVMWDSLAKMLREGDITAHQYAAWVSSPVRDFGKMPNS